MTKRAHFEHFLMTLVLGALAGALELLVSGSWSHLAWAPAGIIVVKWAIAGLTSGNSAPPGPGAFVVLMLASALTALGCATTSTPTSPPITTFGHCSSAALTAASQGILGRVTTALATGDYVDQVAELAKEVGAAEVGCAVDLVISEFTAKAARSDDAMVGTVLAHAQSWRSEHP